MYMYPCQLDTLKSSALPMRGRRGSFEVVVTCWVLDPPLWTSNKKAHGIQGAQQGGRHRKLPESQVSVKSLLPHVQTTEHQIQP